MWVVKIWVASNLTCSSAQFRLEFCSAIFLGLYKIQSRVKGCCLARQPSSLAGAVNTTTTTTLSGLYVSFMECSFCGYVYFIIYSVPSVNVHVRLVCISSPECISPPCVSSFMCNSFPCVCMYLPSMFTYSMRISPLNIIFFFRVQFSSMCNFFSVYLSLFVIGTSLRNTPC